MQESKNMPHFTASKAFKSLSGPATATSLACQVAAAALKVSKHRPKLVVLVMVYQSMKSTKRSSIAETCPCSGQAEY
jgi:hypothetical protein